MIQEHPEQSTTSVPAATDDERPGGPDAAVNLSPAPDSVAPADAPPSAGSVEPASIFAALAAGVTVQDEQGRLVFANPIAARMSGYSTPEELMAATPADLLERIELIDDGGGRFAWDRLPGRRILGGEQPEATLVGFRVRSTGVEQWSIVEARLIVEPDGRRLVVNTFHDVTPRIASERQVRESARHDRE
ncbi:MAG TPA: PAS domain S-box protein, partial [Candidatus Limnocylindrales bacterium]